MDTFILFGTQHFITLALGTLSCILFILLSFFLRKENIAKALALITLVIKVAELSYRYNYFGEKISELLPLHLCNIVLILSIIMMFFNSKIIFQPVYFWSLGAIFAVITPEIPYDLKNFASISFFVTHFFIIFSTFFGLIHFKFRVTKSGAIGSFILLNIIAFILFFVNKKLGTNYLFVNRPPAATSLIDILGPWPYYILSVEGIYVVLSFILYLPFRERKTKYHGF